MKGFLLSGALAACAAAFAADYRLDLGASVRGGSLKVEPHVTGPAGKALRYEVAVTRESRGGRSNSQQTGTVRLDERGAAALASNTVSVNPGDNYRIEVRVFDGDRLVAHESAHHP
jgi:hypothetical protein